MIALYGVPVVTLCTLCQSTALIFAVPPPAGRNEALYGRFQQKLVHGNATRKRGNSDDAAPKSEVQLGTQKLTPMEQQIVELKRKYPGILLIVEVSLSAGMLQ